MPQLTWLTLPQAQHAHYEVTKVGKKRMIPPYDAETLATQRRPKRGTKRRVMKQNKNPITSKRAPLVEVGNCSED